MSAAIDDLRNTLSGRLLKDYPEGTGLIAYSVDGTVSTWAIGAGPRDREEDMRRHLARHIPGAVFLCAAIYA